MKNKFKIVLTSSFVALACVSAGPVGADTFSGTTWALSSSGVPLPDADPLHETYRITLGIDADGYTGLAGSFLDQVAIKVSSSVTAASLFSAPGGTSDWTVVLGGISSSGCSGSGGGFECADSTVALNGGKGVPVNPGTPGIDYSWVFDVKMPNGGLFTESTLASVKGRFVYGSDVYDSKGKLKFAAGSKEGDLVSEDVTLTTTPVPEPETYAMLMAGLGLMGVVARRRKQNTA